MMMIYFFRFLDYLLVFILLATTAKAQQQQDPMTLSGGGCLAMVGDRCVAIATDKRFGSGPQMVNISPRRVLIPNANLIVGFAGFDSDVQSLSDELEVQIKSKLTRGSLTHTTTANNGNILQQKRKETRTTMMPNTMSRLISHILYNRRGSPYYVEPLIAGLIINDNDVVETFLCSQDVIGAESRSNQFVCVGVASKSMYGTAEALWKPNLSPEELVRVCGKAFLSALERDCLSGYGVVLYLITPQDGIQQIELACRND